MKWSSHSCLDRDGFGVAFGVHQAPERGRSHPQSAAQPSPAPCSPRPVCPARHSPQASSSCRSHCSRSASLCCQPPGSRHSPQCHIGGPLARVLWDRDNDPAAPVAGAAVAVVVVVDVPVIVAVVVAGIVALFLLCGGVGDRFAGSPQRVASPAPLFAVLFARCGRIERLPCSPCEIQSKAPGGVTQTSPVWGIPPVAGVPSVIADGVVIVTRGEPQLPTRRGSRRGSRRTAGEGRPVRPSPCVLRAVGPT